MASKYEKTTGGCEGPVSVHQQFEILSKQREVHYVGVRTSVNNIPISPVLPFHVKGGVLCRIGKRRFLNNDINFRRDYSPRIV